MDIQDTKSYLENLRALSCDIEASKGASIIGDRFFEGEFKGILVQIGSLSMPDTAILEQDSDNFTAIGLALAENIGLMYIDSSRYGRYDIDRDGMIETKIPVVESRIRHDDPVPITGYYPPHLQHKFTMDTREIPSMIVGEIERALGDPEALQDLHHLAEEIHEREFGGTAPDQKVEFAPAYPTGCAIS